MYAATSSTFDSNELTRTVVCLGGVKNQVSLHVWQPNNRCMLDKKIVGWDVMT